MYTNNQVDLTVLIQQAIDNGDTATARSLSRVLENQTKVNVVQYQQEQYYPEETYSPQQPTYYIEEGQSVRGISVTWWLCFVILPYLAVAEVLVPGHQGPLKIHQTQLTWPIDMVGSVFGGKDAKS
jgi:hypothetical protein